MIIPLQQPKGNPPGYPVCLDTSYLLVVREAHWYPKPPSPLRTTGTFVARCLVRAFERLDRLMILEVVRVVRGRSFGGYVTGLVSA